MGQSRVHKSRYQKGNHGRYARHPGGVVPQRQMTPEQRLAFLDENGFVAAKERGKCAKRIKTQQSKNKKRSKRNV